MDLPRAQDQRFAEVKPKKLPCNEFNPRLEVTKGLLNSAMLASRFHEGQAPFQRGFPCCSASNMPLELKPTIPDRVRTARMAH